LLTGASGIGVRGSAFIEVQTPFPASCYIVILTHSSEETMLTTESDPGLLGMKNIYIKLKNSEEREQLFFSS
jgi:hypothetical protein